ncbi:MAG: hypothetical protein ABI852_18335 [Gemmatimonadaceae bacterium]
MPLSLTSSLVGLVQWVVPVLLCAWAVRAQKSRTQIFLISVASAVLAGLLMVIPLVQMENRVGEGPDSVLYVIGNLLLGSVILGALVGVVGIIVRTFVNRRQRFA